MTSNITTATETPSALFQVHMDLEGLPEGIIKYAQIDWAKRALPERLHSLMDRMSEGLERPLVSYTCLHLEVGGRFGHGRWHGDGREEPDEIHRLLTIGGTPTEGEDGFILDAGTVWQYSGAYLHRARPSEVACRRMLLRTSQGKRIGVRNHWTSSFS